MAPEDPPQDTSPDAERVVTWLRSLTPEARDIVLEAIHATWCKDCYEETCGGGCIDIDEA